MLKSVNYNGEIFTIEEMQIFQPGVPIRTLTFSSITVSWNLYLFHGKIRFLYLYLNRGNCLFLVMAHAQIPLLLAPPAISFPSFVLFPIFMVRLWLNHLSLCVCVSMCGGSNMCRISCMQGRTLVWPRFHWPAVTDRHPVWTVFCPETHTVAGTSHLGSVLPLPTRPGGQGQGQG